MLVEEKKSEKNDNNKLTLHYLEVVTVNRICVYPIYFQYVYIYVHCNKFFKKLKLYFCYFFSS